MAELSARARELFAEEMAAKFLATADGEGRVNVALIVTLQPPPDGNTERLIFGEFLMWKSKENLAENPRVAAMAANTKLETVSLQGDFRGFQKTGPSYKEALDSSPFMRYNAYSGVRAAGVVDVRTVFPWRKIPMAAVARDFLAVKVKRGGGEEKVDVPSLVMEKFTALTSVKALAVMGEEGYPLLFPVMAAGKAGRGSLFLRAPAYGEELKEISLPIRAALGVVTMDVKSYKLIGTLDRAGKETYRFTVEEAYCSMPPLAGDRIVPR
jgi:hypothetical protein